MKNTVCDVLGHNWSAFSVYFEKLVVGSKSQEIIHKCDRCGLEQICPSGMVVTLERVYNEKNS